MRVIQNIILRAHLREAQAYADIKQEALERAYDCLERARGLHHKTNTETDRVSYEQWIELFQWADRESRDANHHVWAILDTLKKGRR